MQGMGQTQGSENSITMPYKLTGKGPAIVLVPGGLTGWVSWDPFVSHFSPSHQVMQVQLLSVHFGQEDKDLPADYSVRMESEALAGSLREAGITSPVDFIAWSFGAFVLMDFALNHPESVRSITLIEPPAFWILRTNHHTSKDTEDVMAFMQSLSGDISENQLENFMTTVGFAQPGSSLKDHPQWSNWLKFRQSLRNSGHVVVHEDDMNRIKQFYRPVLLVKGTGSAPFLHTIVDLLHQHLPQSQCIELPAGHAPHLVSRDKFLQVFQEFQKKI